MVGGAPGSRRFVVLTGDVMKDIVKVMGVARLAGDPELRTLASGTSVCKLRAVWSNSRKDAAGQWSDVPCFVDMTVWGKQGEACARFLAKGRQFVFEARMEQRSWEDKDTGKLRYAYELVAEQVQFVGGGGDGGGGSRGDVSVEDPLGAAPVGAGSPMPATPDDDIPFLWEDPTWDGMKGRS